MTSRPTFLEGRGMLKEIQTLIYVLPDGSPHYISIRCIIAIIVDRPVATYIGLYRPFLYLLHQNYKDETTAPSTVAASGNAIGPERHVIAEGYVGYVTRGVEFLSNDYTNPNTNPKTLTTLALTLADHHELLKACVRRNFVTLYRTITSPSTVQ